MSFHPVAALKIQKSGIGQAAPMPVVDVANSSTLEAAERAAKPQPADEERMAALANVLPGREGAEHAVDS